MSGRLHQPYSARMRQLSAFIGIGLLVATGARCLHGQVPSHPHTQHAGRDEPLAGQRVADEDAFIRAARAGTQRYLDIDNARADGYRRVGGELPSLGEHWVHNGRALADTLNPAAPPILVYATIGGRPLLAGVAYVRFIAPGEAYPAFPAGVAHAWHDHNGGVDDEVLPLGHLTPVSPAPNPTSPTRLRIAVMHAWIGITNPAGVWTAENWGLPYARVGLSPMSGSGGADARAISLLDATPYYLRAMTTVGQLEADERERAARAVSARAEKVNAIVDSSLAIGASRHSGDLSPRVTEALAAEWAGMWSDVLASVRPASAARLGLLIEALGPRHATAPRKESPTATARESVPPE